MANNRAVAGVFHTEEEAIRAINRLHEMGYTRDEISILAKDPDRFPRLDDDRDINVETPGDVGKGAATGAVTGGVLGGLGFDKEEAKVYEQNLENGDILVIVDADEDRYDNVHSTLRPGDYADRNDPYGYPDRRDEPSLKDRLDRDNDGRLDLDDLRRNPRDTDDKL